MKPTFDEDCEKFILILEQNMNVYNWISVGKMYYFLVIYEKQEAGLIWHKLLSECKVDVAQLKTHKSFPTWR